MNKHVATKTVVPFRKPLEAIPRHEIVSSMSGYLVASILHNGLDSSSDMDIIQCLLDTPERYQSRVVLDHMDDAKAEALQILIAKEMGEG